MWWGSNWACGSDDNLCTGFLSAHQGPNLFFKSSKRKLTSPRSISCSNTARRLALRFTCMINAVCVAASQSKLPSPLKHTPLSRLSQNLNAEASPLLKHSRHASWALNKQSVNDFWQGSQFPTWGPTQFPPMKTQTYVLHETAEKVSLVQASQYPVFWWLNYHFY